MKDVELLRRKEARDNRMAKKITSRTVKAKALHGRKSFAFSIDVYTPDTIPMARLGEYMTELGKMLGEEESVHFDKVVAGSTVLKHEVEFEAVPKVSANLVALKRGLAGKESARHFQNINRMLRFDNAVATYRQDGKSAVILSFPGRTEIVPEAIVTRQRGAIQGTVTRVGGMDETAHVQIVSGEQKIGGCITTRAIAQELGKLLYQDVRLHGVGKWVRDESGGWSIEEFRIDSFDPLLNGDIDMALEVLRGIKTNWQDDALEQLNILRSGTKK
jgi:hypothetical protein